MRKLAVLLLVVFGLMAGPAGAENKPLSEYKYRIVVVSWKLDEVKLPGGFFDVEKEYYCDKWILLWYQDFLDNQLPTEDERYGGGYYKLNLKLGDEQHFWTTITDSSARLVRVYDNKTMKVLLHKEQRVK